MTRGVGGESPANLQKYLNGVDYPASRQALAKRAKDNDAPDEVVEAIENLPSDEFGGPQDVMKAYGQTH
ncbi:DUF2795 domain-containing protein [Hydrocarboniclastica marina]|uniref:DUF2795 domain-containing protein n=1 Tax=Hydrocarboniclastica marina TaxID=2259620 RepID=A0A4P7XK93_9ALTE|nr:DUF2795 domain-containing protein [Hydrocarboniclastica marina]MAL97323.1 hypothetical protein [Alteromonadaceae bacterium]QCF27223.1 DUF2795 domain-containing protein [Hydrocarboniclastica marina]|tara:strand:+ start:1610 stop:1816 length:207 start_codon:yes stop_codon:yes gene_type:complete